MTDRLIRKIDRMTSYREINITNSFHRFESTSILFAPILWIPFVYHERPPSDHRPKPRRYRGWRTTQAFELVDQVVVLPHQWLSNGRLGRFRDRLQLESIFPWHERQYRCYGRTVCYVKEFIRLQSTPLWATLQSRSLCELPSCWNIDSFILLFCLHIHYTTITIKRVKLTEGWWRWQQ